MKWSRFICRLEEKEPCSIRFDVYRNVPACMTPLQSRRVACGHIVVRACELAYSYCPPPPLSLGDSELWRWSTTGRVFRASTRPQHVGPNNKNKHPGVELVPQCEDLNEEHVELPRHTVRGNPILHSLCFSPFSISLPPSFLPFFLLSFAPFFVFSVLLFFKKLKHHFMVSCSWECLCQILFVSISK